MTTEFKDRLGRIIDRHYKAGTLDILMEGIQLGKEHERPAAAPSTPEGGVVPYGSAGQVAEEFIQSVLKFIHEDSGKAEKRSLAAFMRHHFPSSGVSVDRKEAEVWILETHQKSNNPGSWASGAKSMLNYLQGKQLFPEALLRDFANRLGHDNDYIECILDANGERKIANRHRKMEAAADEIISHLRKTDDLQNKAE